MSRLSCVLLVLFVLSSPAHAQSTLGVIRGTVTDPQEIPMPGVTISATSPTVPGERVTTTNREGGYTLTDLPPGEYSVSARLKGFTTKLRPGIDLRSGMTLTVDLEMTLGSIDETITVTSEAPLLDTQRGGHTVNVSGDLLRSMPLSEGREWFGAVTLAPGVTTTEFSNNQKLISVHGADALSNIVQIDGADMTSTSPSYISYISLNTDAIDDVQIKTAGVDASAPLGVGGIINISTSSGTNQARGAATAFFQPRRWNGSNTPGGTSSSITQTQLDLSLGTPVIRDHLWAFAAYRYTDAEHGVSRSPAQLEMLRALIAGYTPFDSTNKAHLWFAKADARLSSSHQLSGFYQYDVNPGAFADAVTERPREEARGGTGASLRLSSTWSDQLLTQLRVGYNDKRRDVRDTAGAEPFQRVYQSTIASGGRLFGNGRLVDRGAPLVNASTLPNAKLTISFDATLFKSSRLGSHELRAGVHLQPRIQVGQRDSYINGGYVYEEAALRQPGAYGGGVVPFHRLIYDGTSLTRLKRRGQDYAFYIQDAWRPLARLTINAGLRVDRITWRDQIFDVISQRSTEVGPRFGVNYALTPDARNIVKAHWVRVHDQPAATSTSAGTVALGQRDLYDLDLDGTFETEFVRPPTFSITPGRSFDPDLHQPFIREWGAGYSRQLPGGLAANADLVRREYRERGTLVETNGLYEDGQFVGYSDEEFNEVYQVTNNRWNRPVYTSIELSATKRSDRVQAIGSYVRQWRHLGGTWQPNDPASFIQPAAFPNDRGIGTPTGSTSNPSDTNSLSGSHMAPRGSGSTQWQDHVVRVGLAFRAPWGLDRKSVV